MATAKKLPSGNWRVNVYVGIVDGKRKYKSFTAPTKAEAELNAALYVSGKSDFPSSCSRSLRSVSLDYINSRSNILSPSTLHGYYNIVYNYIPDVFSTPVSDITSFMLQSAFNTFALNHSSKTLKNTYGFDSPYLHHILLP